MQGPLPCKLPAPWRMIESKDRATSDPEARKKVLEAIEKEGVEYVLFWFTDIEGHLKSFAITPSEMEGALDDGMGFDGSSITGFNAIEESDMVAIPDPATFRLMPAREGAQDGRPHDLRHRQARRRRRTRATRASCMRRALERMQSHGLRHVQHRARARVLPLPRQQGDGDARRGRLLRDDRARRGDRAAQRDDPGARGDGHRRSSTTTTRSRRRSTRSTCATPRRSTWPTRRSRTG